MLLNNSENIVIIKMRHSVHLIIKLMELVQNILWKKMIVILFKLTVMPIVMSLKMIQMENTKNQQWVTPLEQIVNVLKEMSSKQDILEGNHWVVLNSDAKEEK
jgi:hypothetical protein